MTKDVTGCAFQRHDCGDSVGLELEGGKTGALLREHRRVSHGAVGARGTLCSVRATAATGLPCRTPPLRASRTARPRAAVQAGGEGGGTVSTQLRLQMVRGLHQPLGPSSVTC